MFSLRLNKRTPILCMITRLSEQKGIDLILQARDALDEEDVALLILGTGETRYESFFLQWSQDRPDRIATALRFDEPLGHRILAGSDMLLMPSSYEPCGLTQDVCFEIWNGSYSPRHRRLEKFHPGIQR